MQVKTVGASLSIPRQLILSLFFRIVNGVLVTNVAFPGLTVECSTDGGRSWFDPNKATVISGELLLRTR